jgi:pimeloyl-ACP methyl ester carboxylesterase
MNITAFEKVSGKSEFNERTWKLSYKSSCDDLTDWAFIEQGSGNIWVIYLHGHGSTGEQIYTRRDVIEYYLHPIRGKRLGIIAPNLRNNAWMSPSAVYDLHDILNYVRGKHNTCKFILHSESMGGTGALIYAVKHPEDISGIVVGCPATDLARYHDWCLPRSMPPVLKGIAEAIETSYGGKPSDNISIYSEHSALENSGKLTMPIHLSHGNADITIPVDESRSLAEKLSGKKDFSYHEINEGNHDAPSEYADSGLEWVLKII